MLSSVIRDNFIIIVSENKLIDEKILMRNYFDILSNNGWEIILLIKKINDGALHILRLSKPKYIMFTKIFVSNIESDLKKNIYIKNIKNIKENSTKIITLK
ncbi:MAG: hypothetical protein HRS50_01345 [Mycoplasmataceae bacterium]|nr:hypothetical protein [Mycoplasmataceae bacterium]